MHKSPLFRNRTLSLCEGEAANNVPDVPVGVNLIAFNVLIIRRMPLGFKNLLRRKQTSVRASPDDSVKTLQSMPQQYVADNCRTTASVESAVSPSSQRNWHFGYKLEEEYERDV